MSVNIFVGDNYRRHAKISLHFDGRSFYRYARFTLGSPKCCVDVTCDENPIPPYTLSRHVSIKPTLHSIVEDVIKDGSLIRRVAFIAHTHGTKRVQQNYFGQCTPDTGWYSMQYEWSTSTGQFSTSVASSSTIVEFISCEKASNLEMSS